MKHLTPCNIAIVIALGCFSYIFVQSYYEREATKELYKTVKELNEQAVTAAKTVTAILGEIKSAPIVDEPRAEPQRAIFKAKRINRKKTVNPCEEVTRTTTFGNYEVRYKDLKCLNALIVEEQ